MKLISVVKAVRSIIRMADAMPAQSKRRRSNYPFLNPSNQNGTFIRSPKGVPDHNSRVQALGQRASGIRRIKIVH